MKDKLCPECGSKMEKHDKVCIGYTGRITPKPHWFCMSCNIEGLNDGSFREGV